jgi:cysteine desulfurase
MTYLDYSATTPVNDEVLDTFVKVSKKYIGNPNSLHKLGVETKGIIDAATKQIADLLNIKENEIIYTSGASESNNTAIKGIALKYQNRGKHIITTEFEHSSIYGPLNALQKQGFKVDFVKTNEYGIVDLEDLKALLTDETVLVSVGLINSEIGIMQPINEIGKIIKQYPKCFFHVDMTQGLGKVKLDFTNVDLASFTAHKIYGIKGIGVLYKKESISIEPLINGGKSTTVYRSGTPAAPLIASISKAIRLIINNIDQNYDYVKKLNDKLKEELKDIEGVYINSNEYCIPNILNLSVLGIKPETMLHALEKYDIYISTQTACSTGSISKSVYALTKDEARATSSIRISLSHLTTYDDINYFKECFIKCLNELRGVENVKR